MNGRIQTAILDFCSLRLKVSPACSVLLMMREDIENANSRTKAEGNNCK